MQQETTKDATPEKIALDDLITIQGLVDQYPKLLTEYTLRYQLRDRAKNGLARACVRVGRNILISRSRYEEWLASRSGDQVAGLGGTSAQGGAA